MALLWYSFSQMSMLDYNECTVGFDDGFGHGGEQEHDSE